MSSKPKVYVATPCYDMMRVETCVSLLDTFSALGGSGIECKFKSVKTSLVTHGRNLLTCGFLDSGFDYIARYRMPTLEVQPEAVMEDAGAGRSSIIMPQYRVKEEEESYPVKNLRTRIIYEYVNGIYGN
jgi:hypothetical protein